MSVVDSDFSGLLRVNNDLIDWFFEPDWYTYYNNLDRYSKHMYYVEDSSTT